MRPFLLASASAIALGGAPHSWAQTSPSGSPAAPSAAAPASGQPGLTEILVTATKVRTNLQKTPQAITTLRGSDLVRAGVRSAQDLSKLVPGLQIEAVGITSAIYIRGIGSRPLEPTSDPAVVFGVDGVYYNRSYGLSDTFFDVSRIEVVKGPQGTLYGRNATGGAVNVVTNQPSTAARSVEGEFELGDYNTVRATGAVNLPLSDTLAIRIAGESSSHSGYLTDGYDDQDIKGGRVSLAWHPQPALHVFLSADYEHEGGNGPGAVPVGPGGNNDALSTRFVNPSNPWTGPSDPAVTAFINRAVPATALPIPGGLFCVGAPLAPSPNPTGQPAIPLCSFPFGAAARTTDGYVDNSYYGANLTADLDLGFGTLTSVTGFRGTRLDSLFANDATPQTIDNSIAQVTEEVRLASRPGSTWLKWLVGGYYSYEHQNAFSTQSQDGGSVPNPQPAPGSPLPETECISPLPGGLCITTANALKEFQITDPDIEDRTYAFFGQTTVSLTPWLRLTGGLRYTDERKSETDGMITSVYEVPAGVETSYPSGGQVTFENIAYRAGLEVDLAPRSMFYATYATAFHAGGFQLGVAQGPNPYTYQPEEVKSYVAGIKNRFLDNRLQLNVEGFWVDYDNYQQNDFGRVNDGSFACSTLDIQAACPFTLRTDNAAQARLRGVETELLFRPLPETTINADLLYNDAQFVNFTVLDALTGSVANYAGARLPGTNRLTLSMGLDQRFPLPAGGTVIFDIHSDYHSGDYLWFVHAPGDYQKDYTRTDLSLGYEFANRPITLTAYVHNVENAATLLQGSPLDQTTGAVWTNLNPPRTFGAVLGFKF